MNDLENHNLFPLYLPIENSWSLFYIATKNIQIGEELSIDYGEAFWKNKMKLARRSTDPIEGSHI